MKITAVETIRLGEFPNVLWVRIHTDEGLVGLGETFYAVAPVEAHIHETCAPQLLGTDALAIDRHSRNFLATYLGFNSAGVEIRAASAIDIALWDLLGKRTGQPLYQLLGGKSRDAIRVYNTCAGYQYVRAKPVQTTANWGLPAPLSRGVPEGRGVSGEASKPYEDLDAFLHRADELALSLQSEGYGGMKIWPFDEYAERSNGTRISRADLKRALVPFEKIRESVGDGMDIHVEFHSLWDLPTAIEIAAALAPYDPYWFEDPIKMTNLDALADYRRRTTVRVTASETLGTRWSFRELLEKRAVSVVMLDLAWCGGVGEAKKIATMAEAYQLPIAPHDCTGPVVLTASVHLALNCPNALVQEVVRAFYFDWYRELVTALPPLERGHITAPAGPGLGTELLPELTRRPDAIVRVTRG
jgi:L-alanine-DL-glutamate epimerase-like enolase superfamily enzyme